MRLTNVPVVGMESAEPLASPFFRDSLVFRWERTHPSHYRFSPGGRCPFRTSPISFLLTGRFAGVGYTGGGRRGGCSAMWAFYVGA